MKMGKYRINGNPNGSIIDLKQDDKSFSYASPAPKKYFQRNPLMDIGYTVFSLLGEEKPGIYIESDQNGDIESSLNYEDIEKRIVNEMAFVLSFGLKTPIDVDVAFSECKENNGYMRVEDHPYKPKIVAPFKKRKYKKFTYKGETIKSFLIFLPDGNIIGKEDRFLIFSRKKRQIAVEIQENPALYFLKEVQKKEDINFDGIYLDINKRKDGFVRAVGELSYDLNKMLIETHPSILFSFMDDNTEVRGRFI